MTLPEDLNAKCRVKLLKVVADSPPLTNEQIDALVEILGGGHRGDVP